MRINKTLCAATIALSFSAYGVAQADSIASSKLDITNFQWSIDGNGALTNLPGDNPRVDISSAGFNFGNLLVNLDGDSDNASVNELISDGGQIPFGSVCVGPGCGTAPTLNSPPVGTHVYGSHQLTGAIIDLDTDGSGTANIAGGADAFATAESSLISNSSLANATSNLGTNTAFDFEFTGDGTDGTVATTLNLDFNILALASVVNPFGDSDAATAGVGWNFQLIDITDGGNTSVFDWVPSALNHTSGVGAGDADDRFENTGSLSQAALLTGGHEYRVNISHQLLTSATRNATTVPEPSVVALLGIGLLGLLGTASARSRYKS